MRRQIKPFTVERKRNARAPAAEKAGPEAPKDSGPKDLGPPVASPPGLPSPKKPDAPRWAEAEALFSAPPRTEPAAATPSPAGGAGAGRILPSLDEPAPVLRPTYDVDDEPKRRGRRPGSRNKPREPQQGPKTIDTVMRDLFEFWAQEDAESENKQTIELPEPAATGASLAPLALRRRGRAERDDLPRGQRWKARLPRFAR